MYVFLSLFGEALHAVMAIAIAATFAALDAANSHENGQGQQQKYQ